MKFIKKNFGYMLFTLATLVVIYLGYKLNINNSTITTLNESVVVLKKENKDLTDSLAMKLKSERVAVVAVEDTKKAETKVLTNKSEAAKYVEARVVAIEKKYAEKEKTNQNAQLKATEISLERAKGMWLAYCLQEPTVTMCK